MKVLLLPRYNAKGASSRYRFYNYIEYLENESIDVVVKPFFEDQYLNNITKSKYINLLYYIRAFFKRIFYLFSDIKNFDLVIIEKELFPKVPYWFEKIFLKNIKYGLDFDDNINEDYAHINLLKDKIPSLMSNAQYITVGNHWYFEEFKKFKNKMYYLPTVINISQYPLFANDMLKENKDLSVVWIGSHSTVSYLKLIENVLVKLASKYKYTLKIIGAKIDLDSSINVNFIPWSSSMENKILNESSVGIMPLANTNWEKGKCGFKLIQYMASGIPVIGSNLPSNLEIVSKDVGYIADTEEEWYNAFDSLFSDSTLRREMGENGREKIEKQYCYQIWGKKYAEIIKSFG